MGDPARSETADPKFEQGRIRREKMLPTMLDPQLQSQIIQMLETLQVAWWPNKTPCTTHLETSGINFFNVLYIAVIYHHQRKAEGD